MKIGQEKQARQTDMQLRQFEEQKTLEIMKLDVDSDEENKIHPENPEKPGVLESDDFLGNISSNDDEEYLGKNRKLIQAQRDNKKMKRYCSLTSAEIQ